MDSLFLPFPDPGVLPTMPAPEPGDSILIKVEGWPPFKGGRQSLRNPTNPLYQRFVDLRHAATEAMSGRCWYDGELELRVVFHFPDRKWPDNLEGDWALPYVSGIMDTIDGSHGMSYTYLPIVCQDDCQVQLSGWFVVESDTPKYEIDICFL